MQKPRVIRRPVFWTVAVAGLVALLVSIGIATTASGSGSAAPPDLAGRTFVATETPGHELVAGSTLRIAFDEDQLSATAGCNTLFGAATWTHGVLEAPALASTMMACAPELMAQDAWIVDLLSSNPEISLDGATLTIGDADSGLVLVETEA